MSDTVVLARQLEVRVNGCPAPQGSKRHVGGGVMIESSKKVKPWRSDVKDAAEKAIADKGWLPLDGPVELHVAFLLDRPKSVSPKTRPMPTVKPDLDKLVRSTLDALKSAGAYRDDANVVRIATWKRYASSEEAQGAIIVVKEIR